MTKCVWLLDFSVATKNNAENWHNPSKKRKNLSKENENVMNDAKVQDILFSWRKIGENLNKIVKEIKEAEKRMFRPDKEWPEEIIKIFANSEFEYDKTKSTHMFNPYLVKNDTSTNILGRVSKLLLEK